MAFHQNGLTLTFFADEFTQQEAFGATTMLFDVWNLALIIIAVYAGFGIAQSTTAKGKLLSGSLSTLILAYLVYRMTGTHEPCDVNAPIFQQFNPFYVVALTPVSMAIFGALSNKGKEPSAPRKIAYGMLVAAIGFAVMAFGSKDLNTPNEQAKAIAVTNGQKFADQQNKIVKGQTLDIENLKLDNLTVGDSVKVTTAGTIVKMNWKENDSVKVAANILYTKDIQKTLKTQQEYLEKLKKEKKTEESKLYADAFKYKTEVLADSTNVTAATELNALKAEHKETRTSPYWLIVTYLILTFAELLLSPMGISFVSKVAPPKYKGMMMGGWFVATAIGNFLVAVGGFLWAGLPLWSVWAVFVGLCLLSAIFMFSMMKKLEKATK
jgi:dipeptide/tripeptide permease